MENLRQCLTYSARLHSYGRRKGVIGWANESIPRKPRAAIRGENVQVGQQGITIGSQSDSLAFRGCSPTTRD